MLGVMTLLSADAGVPELPRALRGAARQGGGTADELRAARLMAPPYKSRSIAPTVLRGPAALLGWRWPAEVQLNVALGMDGPTRSEIHMRAAL